MIHRLRAASAITGALLFSAPFEAGAMTPLAAERQAGVTARAKPARPNIVLVMADDMRADDLRFAPRIRSLIGGHGLTFRNSFSPFPLCCPARASLLLGVYSHNHGLYWHNRPYGYGRFDDSRTIATSLRRAGYHTGFIGKYVNGYGKHRSLVSGRPSWRYVPRGWIDWRASVENPGNRGLHGDTYFYTDTPYNENGRVVNTYQGRYQTNVIGDFSVAMARRFSALRRSSGKPFFMYVNPVAPHVGGPLERDDPRPGARSDFATPARPPSVRNLYDDLITRGGGMPRGGGPSEADVSDKPGWFGTRPVENRRERRALAEVTRQRAQAIEILDRQVARLVRSLKAAHEWRRTILVFTSDNGYFLGEHRIRIGKVWPYEPALRVPLVVTGPRMREGARRFTPITTVDLTATILDAADARPPRRLDGSSLLRTMRRGDSGWLQPVVTEYFFPRGPDDTTPLFSDERTGIGIRVARYSYIARRRFDELYDLRTDPYQGQNVADDPAYAAVRDQLRQLTADLADCAGAACRPGLPAELATGPVATRRLTREWWAAIERRYGWN